MPELYADAGLRNCVGRGRNTTTHRKQARRAMYGVWWSEALARPERKLQGEIAKR